LSNLLDALLCLQQLDDKLLNMGRKQQEIPEQVQAWEKAFQEETERLEDQKKRHKEAILRQRNLEKELEESNQQLQKKEARKFEVKTNEEYRALLKEVEYGKEQHSKMEDEILMLLDEIDTLDQSIRELGKEVQGNRAKLKSDKERMEQEEVSIGKVIKETEHDRVRLCGDLNKDVLSVYEKIRMQRAGQAVVIVQGEVCPGCHMHIPPQTVNEVLQTGEIRHCPHCRRILFCDLPDTPS